MQIEFSLSSEFLLTFFAFDMKSMVGEIHMESKILFCAKYFFGTFVTMEFYLLMNYAIMLFQIWSSTKFLHTFQAINFFVDFEIFLLVSLTGKIKLSSCSLASD